ncbi:MAG: hypothetical protein ACFLMY_06310 [Candidatus Brachytrichaceae bacterium NZ_4S206]
MRRVVAGGLMVMLVIAMPLRGQESVNFPVMGNDGRGNQWVLQQMGFIQQQGNQPIYSQAAMLQVGGQHLRWRDNNATRDPKTGEILMSEISAQGGGMVQRRVLFDEKDGFARVVDVFRNPTDREITLQLNYNTNLNYGLNNGGVIKDVKAKDTPEVAWFGVTPVNRVAVEVFAGKRSKLPPKFNWQQGNNVVQVNYSLKIPAGKRVAIAHLHGAVDTADEAQAMVREMNDSRTFAYLPPELRRLVANFTLGASFAGDREVLRGDLLDVVELRSGDLLKGDLKPERWRVETFYGPIELPADRVIGLINVGQFRPRQLLVSDQGEIFAGSLETETVGIALSSGQVVNVPISQVARIGYRKRAGEPEEIAPTGAVVTLRGGDRVMIETPSAPMEVIARYGTLKLPADKIAAIAFQSEEHGVHDILMRDGSRFQGLVVTPELAVTLAGGARGQQVKIAQSSILMLQMTLEEAEIDPAAARIELVNGDRLAGRVAGELNLDTAFDTINIAGAQLRAITPLPVEGGDLQLTLWDGSLVSGQLRQAAIELDSSIGERVQIPASLVREYLNPQPTPADAAVERVREIVQRLSADDFKQREQAEQELTQMGAVIVPVLKQLRDTQTPEGQSRIDAVLQKLESRSDAGEWDFANATVAASNPHGLSPDFRAQLRIRR